MRTKRLRKRTLRDPDCTRCNLYKTCEYICLIPPDLGPDEVLIVGEAPGKHEDDSGKPFVGRSGEILREALGRFEIEGVITNAVCCRPPDNRTPRKSEINKCRYWLDRQIEIVKPKYVLILGNVPLQSVLGVTGIKKRRGKPVEQDGVVYMPTYHPSFVIRDPRNEGSFLADLELFSEIVKRGGIPREEKLDYVIVNNEDVLEQMFKELRGTVSYDIETTCLYPWAEEAKITSVGFGTKKRQWIIPFDHEYSNWTRQELEDIVERLTDKLAHNCFLVAHNGKFDSLWMRVHFGVEWYIDFDTMIAHYMLDENDRHGLKYLAQKYYGAFDYEIDLDTKKGKNDYRALALYHAHDVFYTRKLRFTFGKMLHREGDVKKVFQKIMMPCVNIFIDVEYNGVCIDLEKMDAAEKYLRETVAEAEAELKTHLSDNRDVNWGSPQQLAKLLFEDLRIPVVEKTKTGRASTSESVLKRIDHPMVDALLKFRGAKQQLSFFIEGWKPFLIGQWLHPSFKLHGTVTGRLSCEHPNLQQVPRDPRIRSLITAPDGWTLVECDLSQIELRIAAELSGDRAMMHAFITGADIHWRTALGELKRGGGGEHVNNIIKTAKLYCVQQGLPANGPSTKILLNVWQSNKERKETAKFLQLSRKTWLNKKTRSGKRRKSKRQKESRLEWGLSDLATQVSKETLRALQKYQLYLSSSQGRKPKKQEKIQFTDALSILSCIGPSAAQKLLPVWKEIRKKAKAVNFGFLYSMWWKKFKKYAYDNYGVKLTDDQAQESHNAFFATYQDLKEWHRRQKRYARRNGYVLSMSGRKRRLPDAALSWDCPPRRGAERQAINSPVQSFANELNLMALIQLYNEFPRHRVKIVGTVHDAVLFMVKNKYVEPVVSRMLEIMSHPDLLDELGIKIRVPVEAEASVGAWSTGKDLEGWLKSANQK